jgi:NADPH:quinone reductase-like Zn-dependent oxidoreductase
MKAVIHHRYGPAAQALSVGEVDIPIPKDNEVLLRVRAASLHPDVWHVIEGVPMVLRLFGNGLRKPKRKVPGTDLSGVVEAVGNRVTRFKAGDEVFGESVSFGWLNGGAYAEYAAVPEAFLAPKPGNVTFEQAAVVPTSGFIALSNLGIARAFDGKHVLINGAGGCVGTIAMQIVKARGGRVTAVDAAGKLDMIRSLGADRVVDYESELLGPDPRPLFDDGERFDFILDVASTMSEGGRYKRVLKPGGVYVPIGHAHFGRARGRMGGRVVGGLPYFIGRLLRILMNSEQRKAFKMPTKPEAMATFQTLMESGQLTPVVARSFPLDEIAEAMRCMTDENLPGRIVIVPSP